MVPNALIFRAASALTAAGVVLVLANWYVKRSLRRRPGDTSVVRGLDWIATGVVFGALMMGVPLALMLARTYGVVDDIDAGRRSTGVLIGVFLAMLGNVMPKNLPPLASMACDGARIQAFQRLAGWTWVLCGLGSALAWLTVSIDSAELATTVLVMGAMAVTIVQLLRLRRPRKAQPASGM